MMQLLRTCAWLTALALVSGCTPTRPPTVAPTAPQYPDFVYPGVQAPPASAESRQQRAAWQLLQAGDLRGAERAFASLVRVHPGSGAALSGLAYVLLARRQAQEALERFDRVLLSFPAYAPALVGRGQALTILGHDSGALAAYEAAATADPSLELGARIEALRMRGAGDVVRDARKAAEQGRTDEARRAYLRAIEGSPDSAFLYRELAGVESKAGADAAAIEHLRKALALDQTDARAAVMLGDALVRGHRFEEAARAYEAAQVADPTPDVEKKIDELRRRGELEKLPAEYQAIPVALEVTRGDVAAVLGVRLGVSLPPAAARQGVLVTDVRGHWASAWVLDMVRAGIMDPLPNHTFQPRQRMRRSDFAQVVSRVLAVAAARRPSVASEWRNARLTIADVPAGHPAYPAVSQAVAAEVLSLGPGGAFQPGRPLAGQELMDAVARLDTLVGSPSRRR